MYEPNSPDPNDPTRTYGEPFDPNRSVGAAYFLTTIGAGLILAQNWKRLGKPEWVRPTQLASIGAGVGALSLVIVALAILTSSGSASRLGVLFFVIAGVAFGLNFGMMYAIVSLQYGAYKAYKKEGVQAMLAHEYKHGRARLIFGGFIFGCAFLFVGIFALSSQR